MIRGMLLSTVLLLSAVGTAANADGFVNGGFENGTASSWTETGGYRGSTYNDDLKPETFTSSGGGRSAVIGKGTVDPNVGSAFGSTVLDGDYSYRVEDTYTGGYASVLSQKVENYSDASIYFAWKAVLLGAHGVDDAATMLITLKDLSTGKDLISRQYNAADGGSGIDPRFSYLNGNYFTADWQLEKLDIGADLAGHDFLLSILAADCQPTGHWGYVYVDGFGNAAPPGVSGVPEPGVWALMILGFGGVGTALRSNRRRLAIERVA